MLEIPPNHDPELLEDFGIATALRLRVFPYARLGNCTLILADYPPSPEAQHRAKMLFDTPLWHLISPEQFEQRARPIRAAMVALAEENENLTHSSRDLKNAFGLRVFLIALLLWLAISPLQVLCVGLWLGAFSLFCNASLKLSSAFASRHIPPPPALNESDTLPFVSLLIPLYREESIADTLIARFSKLQYPRTRLEICVLVEEDDSLTQSCLARTPLPSEARIIIVPTGKIRTKPRAMNYALPLLHGSIIGIYDAEDIPAPDHLLRVASEFARKGPQTACLQGILDYHNPSATLITRCFTLEYASWFRGLLKGLDRFGLVVPLGGTTLFLRRNVIEALSGWDAYNVTEDADLGLRLARAGYRTEVIDIVTMEEANGFVWPWIKQRSRWLKGFALTWGAHMDNPVKLWRDLGPKRFIGFQIMFLGNIVQTALAPLLWSLWLIPLGVEHPALYIMPRPILILTASIFAAAELVQWVTYVSGARRSGRPWLIAWVPAMHLYFPLSSLALVKALWEILRRPFYWDKTAHGHFKPQISRSTNPAHDGSRQPSDVS